MADPVLVMGDGGWGTALAILMARNGHRVRLWSAFPEYARVLSETRRNEKFLPAVEIPGEVEIGSDLPHLRAGVGMVLSVIPTQFMRAVYSRVRAAWPDGVPIVSCSKGIELGTMLRGSEILMELLAPSRLAVLSGPSHAEEVARGIPTSVVVASTDDAFAGEVQEVLSSMTFRVYTNPDPIGVEVAGALKNVIAIAAGISDGLGFGDNTRAALLTRGIAEIARLSVALGARPDTASGLAGIGDLIATANSRHSRNWSVGYRIGRGETLEAILSTMDQVAEGAPTARAALELARRQGVDMPITAEVHRILFAGKPARDGVESLMSRRRGPEVR